MFHVNNSISLDVVHVWVLYAQLFAISLCSADDAGGDSVLQGERAANGNHKLSWPQISRTAQRQHAKFLLLQQAQKKPLKKYQHTGENASMSEQHRWKEEKTFRGRGIVESLQNSPGISDRGVRLHTSALCLWLTELVFMKVLLMSSRKLSDVDKEMCQDVGCVVYVGSFKIYGCKKI